MESHMKIAFEYPVVRRDRFEPDETNSFSFPCSCCVNRFILDSEEPCRSCDHNVNAAEPQPKEKK